jgi:hypothetical protein
LSVRGHAAAPPEEEDEEEAIAMHPDRFTERVGADKSVVLTPMAWCSAASETGEWEMWRGWSSGGYMRRLRSGFTVLRRRKMFGGFVVVACKSQGVVWFSAT